MPRAQVSAFLASESTSLTLPGCDQCPTFQYGLCAGSNARPSTKDNCFSVCSKTRRECFYGYTYGDLTQSKGYIQRDVLSIPSRDGPPLTATVTFG